MNELSFPSFRLLKPPPPINIEVPDPKKWATEEIEDSVTKLQDSLSETEALAVYAYIGREVIQVQQIEFGSLMITKLHGVDQDGNRCVVITQLNSIQLIAKVVNVQPQEKASRKIGFIHASMGERPASAI